MENKQRLIDYEQAIRATYEEIFWTESEQSVVRHFLAKLPKIDAVELVHGKWILKEDGYHCSNCDTQAIYTGVKLNYCPHCGVKMNK